MHVLGLGPAGAPVATQTTTLDSTRQQPTAIVVTSGATTMLQLNYWYCPTMVASCATNNGNIQYTQIQYPQILSTPGLNVTQTFQYTDGVNRLTYAAEAGGTANEWSQTYSYDQWGNRAVNSTYKPNSYATPTATTQYTNNQWWGPGADYDAAGNQKALASRTFTYDSENRLIGSTQPGMPAIGYAYDGEGRRVQKMVGTSTTTFVYDAMGSWLRSTRQRRRWR